MEGVLLLLVVLTPWAFGLADGRLTNLEALPRAFSAFLFGLWQVIPLPRTFLVQLRLGHCGSTSNCFPPRPRTLRTGSLFRTPPLRLAALSASNRGRYSAATRSLSVLLVFALVRNDLASAGLARTCLFCTGAALQLPARAVVLDLDISRVRVRPVHLPKPFPVLHQHVPRAGHRASLDTPVVSPRINSR